MITLYDCATAPSPRRARIFLAEKGVDHETVQIDLRGAEHMGEAYLVNRALPGPVDYPQIPELGQRGLARVQQFFVTLNEQLAGRDFIAASQFSVADITAVVALDFARVIRLKPEEDLQHLLRWRAAMGERPAMAH